MQTGDIFKLAKNRIQANSPSILTGLGTAGVFITAYLAVKATPEALRRIWDAESEQKSDISTLDKLRLVWPLYAPAAGTAFTAAACILGANHISSRRMALAMGAISISENTLQEYRTKTREVVGEKQEQKIRDEIGRDNLQKNLDTTVVIGANKVLCYDSLSGRTFTIEFEKLRKAQNDVNQLILAEDGAALNEFYSAVGLAPIPIGQELGWNTDQLCELVITTDRVGDEPAFHIAYRHDPKINYDRIWR